METHPLTNMGRRDHFNWKEEEEERGGEGEWTFENDRVDWVMGEVSGR